MHRPNALTSECLQANSIGLLPTILGRVPPAWLGFQKPTPNYPRVLQNHAGGLIPGPYAP